MMKAISVILALVITAFTAEPLLSSMLHQHEMECSTTEQCCDQCSNDCCSIPDNDEDQSGEHDSCQDCSCPVHANVVFTLAITPDIELFETILAKTLIPYKSYNFSLPPAIWHPPKA